MYNDELFQNLMGEFQFDDGQWQNLDGVEELLRALHIEDDEKQADVDVIQVIFHKNDYT